MTGDEQTEDLMRDAVSLTRRLECLCEAGRDPILIGLNDRDWLFVYFGSDPMYRFDEYGRLRRAFVDGHLLRTDGETLAILDRQRDSAMRGSQNRQSILLRRDLSRAELDVFRQRMRDRLEELAIGLDRATITRQHPAEMPRLKELMQQRLRLVLDSQEFLAPAIVSR